MFHDTAARGYRIAQCNVTAAERPHPRPPQRHADRAAGRDRILAAALVTMKCITGPLRHVSRRASVSWCQAGRSLCLIRVDFEGAIMTIGVLALVGVTP